MKTPRRERNSFFPLSGAKEDAVVDEATKGQKKKKDRWSDRETDSSSTKTIIISFKIHVISLVRNILGKVHGYTKVIFGMIFGSFRGHFRVILGSFPDQTPNRAVTAKVTFMVTKWYSFENYLWFFQNRFKKLNLWFLKINYGFGDHVKNYLLVIIGDYHWYLQ